MFTQLFHFTLKLIEIHSNKLHCCANDSCTRLSYVGIHNNSLYCRRRDVYSYSDALLLGAVRQRGVTDTTCNKLAQVR